MVEDSKDPILAVATYQYEEYFDGTIVAVCLTQADTFWPALFFILTISIFFIIPLAILIILYTIIAKNLMENPVIIAHHSKGNNMAGGSVLRYRKQVVLMLGTVVLSFFICLLPFRALTLWIIIVPPETIMSLGLEGYYILLYFCRIMLYLNSAVNPILYNLMSSKFRDGFIKLLSINKCIKFRRQMKDSIHRKDTFNTTTSTNFSSSQNTSDSFWRRYSRSSSQKNTAAADNVNGKNKSIRDGEVVNIQQIKVGEIVNVQNTRRNSMRQVAELAALRNDVGSFEFSNRNDVENIDDVLEDPNETRVSIHKDGEKSFRNKQIQILNLDVKTNNVYAVTLDMSHGEDNKNKFVCVPLLSGKDGNSVNTNKIFEYNSKESFV